MIIFFSNSSPKIPNKTFLVKNTIKLKSFLFKAFFDPNFGIFDFREILQLDKFEAADLKHDNIVFKFQPKKNQIRHFWAQIQAFSLFYEILELDKFEGADLKCGKIVFEFQSKNIQIRHFWSQICAFLFIRKKLQLNKFESASFKYDNSFFKKFWPKNTKMWHFQSHIQAFSFFYENWLLEIFEGADFKCNNIIFPKQLVIKDLLVKPQALQ